MFLPYIYVGMCVNKLLFLFPFFLKKKGLINWSECLSLSASVKHTLSVLVLLMTIVWLYESGRLTNSTLAHIVCVLPLAASMTQSCCVKHQRWTEQLMRANSDWHRQGAYGKKESLSCLLLAITSFLWACCLFYGRSVTICFHFVYVYLSVTVFS